MFFGFGLPLVILARLLWVPDWGCLATWDLSSIVVHGGGDGRWELAGLTISWWWFCILHSHLLKELTQLKEKVTMLKQENRKLWKEQVVLQAYCKEVKSLCEEACEKISGLWTKNQVG